MRTEANLIPFSPAFCVPHQIFQPTRTQKLEKNMFSFVSHEKRPRELKTFFSTDFLAIFRSFFWIEGRSRGLIEGSFRGLQKFENFDQNVRNFSQFRFLSV